MTDEQVDVELVEQVGEGEGDDGLQFVEDEGDEQGLCLIGEQGFERFGISS